MATHIRCIACRTFFDIKLSNCPECDQLRNGFSAHLHKSALDNHLWAQAASADNERKKYNAIKKGYQIPPTKAQKKQAKEIVANYL